ncbi:ABC transporter permease [Sphingomonas antarctica]|uniref:ABC transporter permease/substrate-binding protein n=1 Tax=Sphingomonas antarctica TaxID=2040274 RepID=UPI0039EC81F3
MLSAAALALALLIALPAGVLAARRPGFGRAILGFASFVQTIPGLALLALFFPILLFVQKGGLPVSPLGFLPTLLALTLYALLPIVRNTALGISGIGKSVSEAADAMGMTGSQKLRLVEAPLALPSVMAGIRTAAVWTIGAATLSTTVGQPSLGDMIFSGLQTQNWVLVTTGCLAAAALALIIDGLLALAELGAKGRRKWLTWGALVILVAVPLALLAVQGRADRRITIGAKNFSEQFILARLIGHRLEAAGYKVAYREGLGSAVIFRALKTGEIDVYVDYAGTIWANEMRRKDTPPHAEMDRLIGVWAATQGVASLGCLGFENAYALAMRPRPGVRTIVDLDAGSLILGADLEFLDRPEWAALKAAYGLDFKATRAFAPTFMYDALKSGDADVISAFSSDGRIAADGLTVLADPKGALPGYDALLLVKDRSLVPVLKPLAGAIPVDLMRRANLMVDGEKKSPDEAAAWLERQLAAKVRL